MKNQVIFGDENEGFIVGDDNNYGKAAFNQNELNERTIEELKGDLVICVREYIQP